MTMTLPLVVCGLNHKTAPVGVRSQFFIAQEMLSGSLEDLISKTGVDEAMILSTCNRTEIYTQTENVENILAWWANYHKVPIETLKQHSYSHQKQQTVRHLLRVASGLDSMVLGEPQVLGQLKEAVLTAEKAGILKSNLKKFFEYVFYSVKQVRTESQIGQNPLSLGHAVLHLAKNIFTELNKSRVLLIGAGEVITSVSRYFQTHEISEFILANRSFSKAENIGLSLQAKMISLSEISDYIQEADIIVSAIRHTTPIIGKGMVETAIKKRKHRPMLMVDLAVPGNIETEIKSLEDVYLYHMDDLQYILEENYNKKINSVKTAEELINIQTDKYYEELNSLKINHIIQTYRNKMHELRDNSLSDALREYTMGDTAEEVLQKMAYLLTNKLLHDPCLWLKEAAAKQYWPLINNIEKNL
jgi:glutamyl-tRNA reductase